MHIGNEAGFKNLVEIFTVLELALMYVLAIDYP